MVQVRCVDRATGDMMVRHMMAAQSALAVLVELVVSCRQEATLSGVAGEGATSAQQRLQQADICDSPSVDRLQHHV
jgi:hypothetical protein